MNPVLSTTFHGAVAEANVSVLTEKLADELMDVALGKRQWNNLECPKNLASSVWRLWIEAARKGIEGEEFTTTISSSSSNREFSSIVGRVYGVHHREMAALLDTIRQTNPEVIDMEWKAGKSIVNSLAGPIQEPFASITLKTLAVGEIASKEITLNCDRNQMQDLHWKLKEAQNALRNVQEKFGTKQTKK